MEYAILFSIAIVAILLVVLIFLVLDFKENCMAHLQELVEAVEANRTIAQSAIALIEGIAEQLDHVKDDPVRVQALVDDLRQQQDALAAAVSANTPTQPGPVDPVDPGPVDPGPVDPVDPDNQFGPNS